MPLRASHKASKVSLPPRCGHDDLPPKYNNRRALGAREIINLLDRGFYDVILVQLGAANRRGRGTFTFSRTSATLKDVMTVLPRSFYDVSDFLRRHDRYENVLIEHTASTQNNANIHRLFVDVADHAPAGGPEDETPARAISRALKAANAWSTTSDTW